MELQLFFNCNSIAIQKSSYILSKSALYIVNFQYSEFALHIKEFVIQNLT